jgi:hypothetical protein
MPASIPPLPSDVTSMLMVVLIVSFYDGLGNRVEKSGPSVGGWSDYLYDGGQVAARWTNQVVDHSYVYPGGKLLADNSGPSGALAVNYAHLDQLGSTRPFNNRDPPCVS